MLLAIAWHSSRGSQLVGKKKPYINAFFPAGVRRAVHRTRGSGWERRAQDHHVLSQTPHPFRGGYAGAGQAQGTTSDLPTHRVSPLSGAAALALVGLRDEFPIHAAAPVVPRGDARRRHFQRVWCASEGSSLADAIVLVSSASAPGPRSCEPQQALRGSRCKHCAA
jgi:hypothetical protein